MSLSRSSYYLEGKMSEENQIINRRILELSTEKPRYGYRRITVLMKREGRQVNAKRVQRVRAQAGLQVRKRQRKKKRVHPEQTLRRIAVKPGEVWSWDFVSDQTGQGSRFRILSLIDEYTRQCLLLQAGWTMTAREVITHVSEAIKEHGAPEYIRSDNGPEFVAYALQDWLAREKIRTIYIKPGSPWEQCWIESFHDKLRDEHLNREWYGSLAEARVLLEAWRCEYNDERPHSSLAYLTPNEYARARAAETEEPSHSPDRRSLSGCVRSSVTSALEEKTNPNKTNPMRSSLV